MKHNDRCHPGGSGKSRRPPRQEIPHLLPNCSAVKQTRFCLWKSQQLEVARTLNILKLKSKNASKNIKNQSNVLHVNLIPQPLHNDLQSLETLQQTEHSKSLDLLNPFNKLLGYVQWDWPKRKFNAKSGDIPAKMSYPAFKLFPWEAKLNPRQGRRDFMNSNWILRNARKSIGCCPNFGIWPHMRRPQDSGTKWPSPELMIHRPSSWRYNRNSQTISLTMETT